MQDLIEVHFPGDFRSFVDSVKFALDRDEAENSLLLGLLAKPDPRPSVMAIIRSKGEVLGVAYQDGPNLIVTNGCQHHAHKLVDEMVKNNIRTSGLVGPTPAAEAVATEYSDRLKLRLLQAMDQGFYKLDQVTPPSSRVPGQCRLMTADDVELVAHWLRAFMLEAIPSEAPSPEEALRLSEARVDQKMTFLWEAPEGPVAMAALARPTAKSYTVNAVYSPTQNRRKGFATELVAQVSSEGLKRGKEFCVLFTDLANTTSNSIYAKVGYRRIGGSRLYKFYPLA